LSIRVFDDDTGGGGNKIDKGPNYKPDDEFTAMLVDALQYDDVELILRSFKALVALVAQDFMLANTIDNVVLITKESMLSLFFNLSIEISDFRRLYKWTHESKACKQLIGICDSLVQQCYAGDDTDKGEPSAVIQNLMRNLGLPRFMRRFLMLREPKVRCIYS
jgi:hypothetical protein